jgi:tetratricopeptide (TPR) repeat protein/energy-coupling factor transporter ATP-binding protein EcfA2
VKTAESPANPFPGLRPFQFHENRLFFGREGQSEELLRKLRLNRFLAVVGTSGSGKSSLVRAGLLPLLYGGFMAQAGPQWRIALFRPGKDPIHNMAVALNSPTPFEPGYMEGQEDLAAETSETEANAAETNAAELSAEEAAAKKKSEADLKLVKVAALETTLRRSAVGLVDYVRRARMRAGENLLVVVDQFEELFRFKEKAEGQNSQDEAAAFVKLLLEAVEDETAPIYVVLTMRSDFLGDCAQFRDLPEKINESQYLIPRMTRDQRRDAITSPAAVRGAKMTQRLLNRLLNDVGDNPDQLPILQHALMRTWDFWAQGNAGGGERGEIDLQHYEAIGTMEGALSKHADEAYNGLPDARSKQIAEKMFKALTETVTDSREVRRPSVLREICAVAEATEEEVKPVIEVFRHPGRSFLMPPPGVELEANTLIDISHESLIRNWALMKEWVKEEAQSSRIYRRVAEAATLYREGREGLLTDPGLQFALEWREKVKPNKEWAKRYHPEFDATLEFLKKSEERRDEMLAAEERRKQEELERDKRELAAAQALAEAEQRRAKDQTRAARKFRVLAAALAVMLLVAAVTAIIAYRLKGAAESQKSVAEFQKAAAEAQRAIAEKETIRAQEAETKAKESLAQLADALSGKEKQREKAEKATLEAQAQAKAAKAAEKHAQLAQAEEKKRAGELVQANTKNEMNREGLEAFERGDLSTALSKLTTLLELSHGNPKAQAWIEYNLGTVFREKGDYEAAAANYEKALAKQEAFYGEKSHESAATLNKLARVYRQQGNYKVAEEKYNKVLEIQKDYFEQKAIYSQDDLYELKSEMADFYMEQARDAVLAISDVYADTLARPNQVADPKDKAQAPQLSPEERAKLSQELSTLRQTKIEEAGKLYEEVAAFREQEHLFDNFSPNHPDMVASYAKLADFYEERGRSDDKQLVTGLYELARTVRSMKLKPGYKKDPFSLEILNTIGDAYATVNRVRPASRIFDEMLAIAQVTYPNDASVQTTLLVRIGEYYREQKKYAEAEPLYLKLLTIFEKAGTKSQQSDLREEIGRVYWEQGKHAQAEEFFKQALVNREQEAQTGNDRRAKWQFLLSTRMLARLADQQHKLAEAEAGYKQALANAETLFGAGDGVTAACAYDLGHFYFEQKREAEAEPLLRRTQSYYLSKIGPDKRAVEFKGTGQSAPQSNVPMSGAPSNGEKLQKELRNEFGTYNTPDIYVKALSDLAAIKAGRNENQEAEALYKEIWGVLAWLRNILPGLRLNSPFVFYGFEQKEQKESLIEYTILEARSLEAYAALMKKLNRTAEAQATERQAKNRRTEAATHEAPPPWIP